MEAGKSTFAGRCLRLSLQLGSGDTRGKKGRRLTGGAHTGGSDVLIGVPLTDLENVLMVMVPRGFVYMTGGMVDTGV